VPLPYLPCPDEAVHPGQILVIVRDGKSGEAAYEYSAGSAPAQLTLTPFP
jgi:hypothetical protein